MCLGWLASPGSSWTPLRRYGNINPLSIDYACRPRLRSRLTQGRLSLTLEPLIIRRTGFSPVIRYSCLHSHSCAIHAWITPTLHPTHDAPLPTHTPEPSTKRRCRLGYCVSAMASAGGLSPATLSARNHLTSELLRTLSRVAASKPTSWLSLRLHILFHLAAP